MHLRALALFKEIYWAGSITGGAAAANISQPAASRMLRHLEDQLGYRLFERIEGRIRPTAEARILIVEVDEIFARVRRATEVAHSLGQGAGERLAVVCTHTLAVTLLPAAMSRLRRRFPGLDLALDTQGLTEQLNSIERRAANLGIATGVRPPPGFESRLLGRSRFVAIMPAAHPLAAQPRVALADYARFPCILWASRGPLGQMLTSTFEGHGVSPDVTMTIGSPLLCGNAVRAFGTLAIIDSITAATMHEAKDIAIRPLDIEISFARFAFWNAGAPASTMRDAFLRILEEALDAASMR